MKPSLFICAAALGLSTFAVHAETYPILESYKVLATELIPLTQNANSDAEKQAMTDKTRVLISQGEEIMKLYQTKNPNCADQFSVFFAEMPAMENLSVEEAHRLYHDGEGLPAAPRHCYMGRSQVIHPMMNLIRFTAELTDEVREEGLEELDEVIRHLDVIQKNLDNPPN